MKLSVLIFIILALLSGNIHSQEINRNILALWDSSEFQEDDIYFSNIHQSLEVVFNHFGFDLTYVDIEKEDELKKIRWSEYHGAVSWFTDDKATHHQLLAKKVTELGALKKPYLCLGYFGFFSNILNENRINNLIKDFKISYGAFFQGNPLKLNISYEKNKNITSFERSYEGELVNGFMMKDLSKGDNVYLKVNLDGKKSPSDVVILRRGFGYAQREYDAYVSKYLGKRVWRLNPFYAVEKVFGPFDYPIPDTTTLFGKRIGYVHIDGDGFINRSNENKGELAGKVILEKIIEKYKIPTGVSFINAEIFPQYLGNDESLNLFKEYLKKHYLEFASHTYTHPLSWSLNPNEFEKKLYLEDHQIKKHKGPITAYRIPGHQMTFKKEIEISIKELNKFIRNPSRKIKTLYWSGNCRPPKGAMEALGEYLNLNGGDTRMDDDLKTYATVFPLSRKVGKFRQIYSSNSNENTYTNLWTGPFSGFSRVLETFRNTESPIRIKPSNIYYHFYSGDKYSALTSLEKAYDYLVDNNHNIIFPSHYVLIIKDFFKTRIEKVKKNVFLIKDYNNIRTLRLEDSTKYPNFSLSKNIIGFEKINGINYIHLSKGKEARLVLTDELKKPAVLVRKADGVIDSLELKKDFGLLKGYSENLGEVEVEINNKVKKLKIEKKKFEIKFNYDHPV
ncbi:MAG: hypothetical protein GY909_13755 [Oligoflexia bacterium]|nr:hypothetical protein [Oligoflexia bacterium]